MQEKTTLTLSRSSLTNIEINPEEMQEYLYQELQENLEQIRLMVSGYFFLERKTVNNLTIDKESMRINTDGSGTFEIKFTIGIIDGCADIHRSQDDSMLIHISSDLTSGKILLTGENIPERHADDF